MIQVALGSKRFGGVWAALILIPLLLLIGVLVVWSHARVGMLISAAFWVAMMIYWSQPVKGAPPSQRTESLESRKRHQLIFSSGLLLLFIPVPLLTAKFLPDLTWLPAAGLALQAGGALLYVWARQCLGQLWSGEITIKKDHFLVASGPYRIVRHPMYTAILAMCLGTTIVAGQYHALIGLALAVYAYLRKIRIEEETLTQQFGASYAAYRKTTRTLIPWVA
jgi:protein-S-isoprenylcysteine O-methyltransferase Ste14